MAYSYSSCSDIGTRENNEDFVGTRRKGNSFCFVVADGLGGHGNGELASSSAGNAVLSVFDNLIEEDVPLRKIISLCFEEAQNSVLNVIERSGFRSECKTTLVILIIRNDDVVFGHIGDSRLYQFKKSYFNHHKIVFQTLDHSVPQMLVYSKEIKASQIRNHPDRNRLLRVIGVEWDTPRYEIDSEFSGITSDSAFLLCTDGFWEWIDENEMRQCLKRSKSDSKVWLEMMKSQIEKKAGNQERDNCSAITIIYQGD